MDFSSKPRTLLSICSDIADETFDFRHPLQRKEKQWNLAKQQELIDSALRGYPVDPVRCEKKNDKNYVFDGKQRLLCCYDYSKDAFALAKDAKDLKINKDTFQIAGLKFSELPEKLKDRLMNKFELTIYEFTNCTEEDIREMFRRQNDGGVQLNNSQKRTAYESYDILDKIAVLAEHNFFTKVMTPSAMNKDLTRDVIRQVLMLISDYDVTSLKDKDLTAFVIYFNEHFSEELITKIKKALDALDTHFETKLKVKKLIIPMMIYGAVLADNKIEPYLKWLDGFINTYDDNEEFKQYCGTGTANADKVSGRIAYFENAIKKL